jgi:hypothetical protein
MPGRGAELFVAARKPLVKRVERRDSVIQLMRVANPLRGDK